MVNDDSIIVYNGSSLLIMVQLKLLVRWHIFFFIIQQEYVTEKSIFGYLHIYQSELSAPIVFWLDAQYIYVCMYLYM